MSFLIYVVYFRKYIEILDFMIVLADFNNSSDFYSLILFHLK